MGIIRTLLDSYRNIKLIEKVLTDLNLYISYGRPDIIQTKIHGEPLISQNLANLFLSIRRLKEKADLLDQLENRKNDSGNGGNNTPRN